MWTRFRPQTFRSVLLLSLLFLLGFFSIADGSLAQSTNVTADIPAGIIEVVGKTSPNAQVEIFEDGSSQPAASLSANAAGEFSVELPQYSTGVVAVSIQATDTDGVKNELISNDVAVLAHQTSTLTVVLPPNIVVSPSTAVFQEGIINFSGQTVPNADVEVTIEPSTILSAVADSEGNYVIPLLVKSLPSVGVYTFGVQVSAGAELSEYVIAGTFVITPPVEPPVVLPPQPLRDIIDRFTGQTISAPEITYPSSDEFAATAPFVMSGQAEPGALVTIYDDREAIGTVVAGEDGSWQFYFAPYKETHRLYANACIGDTCSENSRTVTVTSGNSKVCRLGITLENYRLKATVDQPMTLSGEMTEGISGSAYIDWGDASNEHFSVESEQALSASHSYQEAGTYSGYVVLSGSGMCYTIAYFAVEVANPAQPVPILLFTALAVIALAVIARLLLLRSAIKTGQ